MTRRVDQAYVIVSVTYRGETRDLGVFNELDGGEATSDDTKIRRGGTRIQRALGGPRSIGNVTVTRDYDLARDHTNIHWLYGVVGAGRVVVQHYMTDDNDAAYGRPIIYTGVLIRSTKPPHNIDSADVSTLELEVSCDGFVG
jgi:hypothetical protein